jgi:hypothetical protein
MKFNKWTLGLATVAAMAFTSAVRAQSIQMPAFPTNLVAAPFLQTAAAWATSYNTNYIWTNGVSIDTGIATTTGQNIADRLNINYDFNHFDVGIHGTFVGVGSAFDSAGIHGTWWLVKKYDLKLGPTLDLDYQIAESSRSGKTAFSIAPGIKGTKVITGNTYATAEYSYPIRTSGKATGTGTIYIGTGFTF